MSINRYELVHRNNPVLNDLDIFSPLSVGNGEFAYTVDVTGLQTFPEEYETGIPICTMSNWGWHTLPLPEGEDVRDIKPKMYDTYGRKVGYYSSSEGQEDIYNWLRENPHKFNLGQVGFCFLKLDGSEAKIDDIKEIEQTLDMWTGTVKSAFEIEGESVVVETCCHPVYETIAVYVKSNLIRRGRLKIVYKFPYGSGNITGGNWNQPEKHHTQVIKNTCNSVKWSRVMDKDNYFVDAEFSKYITIENNKMHSYIVSSNEDTDNLQFTTRFSANMPRENIQSFGNVVVESNNYWEKFWTEGGAIDLSESKDPRAVELERRIILSQYLTAIQCSGSIPPQETGLTCNSWFGKPHLEMHWWHVAHFALWGRIDMLENSMWWYKAVMHKAEENAKRQGYKGVRWTKMVGPDGTDSPSNIAPLLIWQQPHPIFYAELCYRAHPNTKTLELYKDIVFNTAEFMVSFAVYDENKDRFVLGPPVIPAQEKHEPMDTINPTYELEYWYQGLSMAQEWRERLGMERNREWDNVISKLSKLPVKDNVYIAHENCPDTFSKFNVDHPSMLNAYGVLPGKLVDKDIMRNTLFKVLKEWDMPKTWGWDYPVMAMTAARLGESEVAIQCLLMDTPKNVYHKNGHNYQRDNLPLYLPGNGGLLVAVAMMVAGWDNGPSVSAPGFPKDGSWTVKYEGIDKYI